MGDTVLSSPGLAIAYTDFEDPPAEIGKVRVTGKPTTEFLVRNAR